MTFKPTKPPIMVIGFGPTAQSALMSLTPSFEVLAFVRDLDDTVAEQARGAGMDVRITALAGEIAGMVSRLKPDCVVVSSFNRILPSKVLDMCPFVNVHYAPLPGYRGRANVNWAILNRESHAAVTVHSMVSDLDAGDILAQQALRIRPRETVGELYQRLNSLQGEILPGAVTRRLGGDTGDTQDASKSSYGCTRVPNDGEIDWSDSTYQIDALVRALSEPYPGAFTFIGMDKLAILEAEPSPENHVYVGRIPGRIVKSSQMGGWSDVLTGDGVLRIRRIKFEGADLRAAAILRGTHTTLGLQKIVLLERINALQSQITGLISHGKSPEDPGRP